MHTLRLASCRLRVVFVSLFCLRFVLVSLRLASCRLRVVFVPSRVAFRFVFVSSSFRCASLRVAFMSSSCRFSFLSSLRPLFVSSRFVFVHLYCEHSPLPSTRVVIPRPSVSNHHFVSFVCRQLVAPSPGFPVDFAVAMASVNDHVWNMLPLFLLVLVTLLSNFFDSVVPGTAPSSNLSETIYNQCATPSSYRMGIALGPPPTQPRLGGRGGSNIFIDFQLMMTLHTHASQSW